MSQVLFLVNDVVYWDEAMDPEFVKTQREKYGEPLIVMSVQDVPDVCVRCGRHMDDIHHLCCDGKSQIEIMVNHQQWLTVRDQNGAVIVSFLQPNVPLKISGAWFKKQ